MGTEKVLHSREMEIDRKVKKRRKKRKKSNQYTRNREHIKQVKKRKDRENRKKIIKRISKKKGLLIAVCCVFAFALLMAGGVGIVRDIGKNHLLGHADMKQPDLHTVMNVEILTEEEENEWQEGWIKYNGKIYQYNEEIMTFLVMGIDKYSNVEKVAEGTEGGQADALFLAVLNPKDKSIKIMGINRNTITDIDMYDANGDYVRTIKAQIAVQHGFGNGVEESCEYQVQAVEKLLYGLPIHGYAAVNMSAIETINDAVGGVEVTVLEDLTKRDKSLVEGAQIHLMGETAFWYVKYRDTDIFASADMRLERQKQYLKAFINRAKQAAKEDISVVLDLYQGVMPQMVTNVSLDEVAYLAPLMLEYQFSEESFYSMEGKTVKGNKFEEFYPDEETLREMVLEIFYEEVEFSENGNGK